MTAEFKEMQFHELEVGTWFRLRHDGPSYMKKTPTSYYQDTVMGEVQVLPWQTVIPIVLNGDTPVVHV